MIDVYKMITDRIIKTLESGVIPWKQPWCLVGGGAFNRVSGKSYSLLNQMNLLHNGEYASYDQWNTLGGEIKKGEKAEKVMFWKRLDRPSDKEKSENEKPRYVLRYYNVFHISQVTGVDPLPSKEDVHEHDRIQEAEELINRYTTCEKLKIEEELSSDAYYSPVSDVIHIPALFQYKDASEYYSTVIHEIIHSTGHEKRLNRPGLAKVSYGSEEYSKEELIAEIGAASILNGLGIESEDSFFNSVAYIEGWLSKLREDKHLIVNAASAAEKAVKYVYNANMAANA